MLNRLADLVRLRTYANTLAQPVSRVSFDALRALTLGEHVRAQVEAALPDGSVRVTVRNQELILRLPFAAQKGDNLQLVVAAREPQLRFTVAAPAAPPAVAANLSETARFVTALLGETAKLPVTAPAHAGTPLLATPPGDHVVITAELRRALATSGMFYESHQAQWAEGDRPLAALLQEPQAQLPPLANIAEDASPARVDARAVSGDDALPRLPELPVHRDALSIVRHQLETLDTRQVVWHGLIWHGQPLEWEVTGHPPATDAVSEEQPWRTRLRLTLPRLGAIDATLLVAAHGVAVMVHAASDAAAATLADHQAELQQALRNAGVPPLRITVCGDEAA